MKKKILLTLALICAACCLFAISVSADKIVPSASNEYGELTVFDVAIGNTSISDLKDDGTVARTVLFDGTEYYTVPTTYILKASPKNSGGKVGEMLLWNFSELNTKLGKSFNKNSIIRSEIPSDIDFICSSNENYNNCNNVIEIIVNDGLRIWDNNDQRKVFTNCKKLVSIDISGMVIEHPKSAFAMFEYCESLESIILPDAYFDGTSYVNYDTNHMFSGCKKLKNIENFDGFFKGVTSLGYKTFYNCYVMPEFKLWDGLTMIEGRAFGNCYAITSMVIPDSVTQIGSNNSGGLTGTIETVFEACTSLKTVVLPSQVTLGNYCFEKCTALTAVWMPTKASTFGKQVFGQCGNSLNVTFYFTTEANTVTVTDMENKSDPYITAIKNGTDERLKFNTPVETKCIVFFGNHDFDSADLYDIVYASYDQMGFYKYTCPTCDGYTEAEPSAPALFTSMGASTPEFVDNGLAIGYIVDFDAIADYEGVTGKKVGYGVFAVSQNKLGGNEIFGTDGASADGVISLDLTDHGLDAFELKITGFETDEQKGISLAFGAYVFTTCQDEEAEYSYLQIGNPAEGEKYYFASYNEIKIS